MQHALRVKKLRLWQGRRESILTGTDPEQQTHRRQLPRVQGSSFAPTKRKPTLISTL